MSAQSGPFFPILQVDEIAFAMTLFVGAASLKIPVHSAGPAQLPTCECGTLFEIISTQIQRAANLPQTIKGESSLEYAFMAMWRHYEGDNRRQSICARILGFHSLMVLTQGEIVEPWLSSAEETPEVVTLHPAVVEAIAITPLGHSGVMTAPGFLQTLNLIADVDIRQAA
jgi:hypothetical protein